MAAQPLQTAAFVLGRKASSSDSFDQLTLFSAEHGILHALRRVRSARSGSAARGAAAGLDLFDEADFRLESSNQGRTWFVQEHTLVRRASGIGRSYEALRCAAAVAALVTRNPIPDESRTPVAELLRRTLAALEEHSRADIVWLKTLYLFLRDEGHPVRQQWWTQLPKTDRDAAAAILNRPLSGQNADAQAVSHLTRSLEDWLHANTEVRL